MKHSSFYWLTEIGQFVAIVLFVASLIAGPAWLAWASGAFLFWWFIIKWFGKH